MNHENSIVELREFFSIPGRPVSASEMMEFWKSLSDEDKVYYKSAPLS